MFCYQCEQAKSGKGCDAIGICGKQPDVAGLQDVLIYQLKGIGYLAHAARELGAQDRAIDRFITEALFTTVTNVDFDPSRLLKWIKTAGQMRAKASELLQQAAQAKKLPVDTSNWPAAASYQPRETAEELLQDAATIEGIGVLSAKKNEDVRSLQELLLYGLKGMAAYADHASILGQEDASVYAFFHEALAALNDSALTPDKLFELNLRCGEVNIRAMELLDHGHTTRFGHPEPTSVPTAIRKGPAIIVSGHDLVSLEALLQQTTGKGISVYTHGEMLPAHGYPGLKKYPQLAGHFGTAWQNQQKEFDGIPAAILFNTNCIQKPRASYADRVFTSQLVAWPGVQHIEGDDFSPLIRKALDLGGFEATAGKPLMTGFARNAVLSVADKIIAGVKSGAIKHFFLVGGCDGAKPGRNYYTELVEKTPQDTLVLTLACGKFRFNHLELGDVAGIPRLLDVGQCNDAYSAVKIAQALAGAFECGVNDLPLSLILSWYEQKAVVVLLSLLALGIKGIRLGPTLPAFITPNVLKVLVEKFEIKPITTPDADLRAALGKSR